VAGCAGNRWAVRRVPPGGGARPPGGPRGRPLGGWPGVFAPSPAKGRARAAPPLTVTDRVEPLTAALVTDVPTKSMTSPACQPEIVPLRAPGCTRSNVAPAPPKVTSEAAPPEDTYSVPPLLIVVTPAAPPLCTC